MTTLKRYRTFAAFVMAVALWRPNLVRADAIPISCDLTSLTADVVVDLSIDAPLLSAQVFGGKNVVIPISVRTGRPLLKREIISADMLYQFVDPNGATLTPQASVPVIIKQVPSSNQNFKGAVYIPVHTLPPVNSGGQIQYYFRTRLGSRQTLQMRAPSGGIVNVPTVASNVPFNAQYIETLTQTVSPSGSLVTAQDTDLTDGKTTISLPPGAVAAPAALTLRQENLRTLPAGPAEPIVAYSITLDGASLQRPAQITLSYPANPDGTVGEHRLRPTDLAMYSYENLSGWRLLGRPQIDTTLHTVMTETPHLSLFALFATGSMGASDLRPPQRILTPNNDGSNDTITFSGLSAQETVRIFDMRGRRIQELHGPPHSWDGRDDGGHVVESGVYLYQYTSQGQMVSGLIMVAK